MPFSLETAKYYAKKTIIMERGRRTKKLSKIWLPLHSHHSGAITAWSTATTSRALGFSAQRKTKLIHVIITWKICLVSPRKSTEPHSLDALLCGLSVDEISSIIENYGSNKTSLENFEFFPLHGGGDRMQNFFRFRKCDRGQSLKFPKFQTSKAETLKVPKLTSKLSNPETFKPPKHTKVKYQSCATQIKHTCCPTSQQSNIFACLCSCM